MFAHKDVATAVEQWSVGKWIIRSCAVLD